MRIIVTGSRDWEDGDLILDTLYEYENRGYETMILKHGGCRGADLLAAETAKAFGWKVEVFPADWEQHGKAAGPVRNQKMVDSGADLCIAFPVPGSRGTWDCIKKAVAAGIRTVIVPGKPR